MDRSGLPTNDVTEIVVENRGRIVGRFELLCATRVVWATREQRLVAVTLAEQAGAALTSPDTTLDPGPLRRPSS